MAEVDHHVRRIIFLHLAPCALLDPVAGPRRSHLGCCRHRARRPTREQFGKRDLLGFAPFEYAVLLVERTKKPRGARCRLRRSEEQPPGRFQSIVEGPHDTVLHGGIDVDQQIAARDQIELRKRRILDDALRREHAHLADFGYYAIIVAVLGEPALEPVGRYARHGFPEAASPCGGDRAIVDIGSENLDLRFRSPRIHRLAQQNGQREDFLSRRAAGHPDPHGVLRVLASDETLQNCRVQRLERGGIAKELRYADQQFAEQRIEFFGLVAKPLDVIGRGVDLKQLHPALEPAKQRFLLILAEIMAAAGPQRANDCRHVRRGIGTDAVAVLASGNGLEMRLIRLQLGRHRFDRQHIVDLAGCRRALRHSGQRVAVIFRLRQCQPAMLLDRGGTQRSVAPGARQDDANGVLALIFGQRLEEGIDRPTAVAGWRRLDDLQASTRYRHRCVGRNDEDAVRLDQNAVGRLDNVHRGGPAEQFGQHAFIVRREMLDEHIGHASIGRGVREEALERIEAACRSADADDERQA